MAEVITLPNLCPHVRIEIDGKAYRVFSIRYTHPKDSSENAWSLFTGTTEKPILIDKDTLQMLAGKEITWLYKDASAINLEPTIAACEIRDDGPIVEEVD
jgi:hypothetical protein